MPSTLFELSEQWANPSDVTTVLMVIGGDIVQKALAQTTGCLYTPVCFSFGWVAYTFSALVNILGDGRLLPPPDYAVKVFNLRSGYARENRNWVIGRLVRDNEAYMARSEPITHEGIRISVWQAEPNKNRHTKYSYSSIHAWGLAITVVQLLVASIPLFLGGEQWGILLITGAGTILSFITGSLPQWTAEKLPNRQKSKAVYALTSGNGSKDVMVINGAENCLDLEELCSSSSPRTSKVWEKFSQRDQGPRENERKRSFLDLAKPAIGLDGSFHFHRTGTQDMVASTTRGIPRGFWITLFVCAFQSIAWLALLTTVAALNTDTWYLIVVGGIGMFQNGYLAAMERQPKHRNLPLIHLETIKTKKVMDGIMDLEATYGWGRALLTEFFPGPLRAEEEDWWNNRPDAYDEVRTRDIVRRGPPRSRGRMPNFENPYLKRVLDEKSPESETSLSYGVEPLDNTPTQEMLESSDGGSFKRPQSPVRAYHKGIPLGSLDTLDETSFEKREPGLSSRGFDSTVTLYNRERASKARGSFISGSRPNSVTPNDIASMPEWV